ncbi:putative serine/threonine-protein kinase pknB [Planctomycetales bacterium 10988]|nr:putative serine/threonine-protein kinase pknB [Planctomycetales bacterium 10988]
MYLADQSSGPMPLGDPTILSPEENEDSDPSIGDSSPSKNTEPPPSNLHPLELAKHLRGESLNHFILEDFVGIGGMGIVFRARDTQLNRIVAVKVLPPEQASQPETQRRFRNEAQSAARLDHENIARVYYLGEDRGLLYIVFEYIEGSNLRDLVSEQGPLPLPQAVSCILHIASALAHVSQQQVVHRDVKPSNILLTTEGTAKLVDMGLARLHHHDQGSHSDLTRSGVTLGTFDYISPEQARDPRQVDARSDIYSLGCTFFYALTSRPPYPNGTVLQKLLQHHGEAPPDPREVDPTINPQAARIIGRMMAKDPDDRYQTPEDLVKELMLLAGQLGLKPTGPSGLVWISPESLRPYWAEVHLPWLVPVVVLIVLVGLLETLGPYRWSVNSDLASSLEAPGNPYPDPKAIAVPSAYLERPEEAVSEETEGDETLPETNLSSSQGTSENSTTSGNLETSPATSENSTQETATPSQETNATEGTTSNSGESVETTTSGPTSEEESELQAPLVTDPFVLISDNGLETPYDSFAMACQSAEQGDRLELHFDGVMKVTPVMLNNPSLTIQAGPDYAPILELEGKGSESLGQGTHLLTVTGGRLVLKEIAIRLSIPAEVPTGNWSMIRTRAHPSIEIFDCALTLRNPSGHLGASFVEVDEVAGSDASIMREGESPAPQTMQLVLSRCIARGEGSFVRADRKSQTMHIDWDQGLIVLGNEGPFLQWRGSALSAHPESRISVNLRRITADIPGGLCWLSADADSGNPPPKIEIQCENSILIGSGEQPLIMQTQVANVTESQLPERILWTGDEVYYENWNSWWTVQPRVGMNRALEQPVVRLQSDWITFWGPLERNPHFDEVQWQEPPDFLVTPVHQRSVRDYSLDPSVMAIAGASFSVLPSFPEPSLVQEPRFSAETK